MLLEAATGLTTLDLLREPARLLHASQIGRLSGELDRRLAHEPVSRIRGEREFYGRAFHVSPATLDPRADTETVIEAVLHLIAEEGLRDRPLRLLDVGTGTGCIAITLLAEMPFAWAVATDISTEALLVARRNAVRHAVADRVSFVKADLISGVEGPFDLAVSNPPYIRTAEIESLAREVRCYDPRAALDGGVDGLNFYWRIAADVPRVVSDGWIVVEVGAGQANDVAAITAGPSRQAQPPRRFMDLGGHERVVAFRTRR